MRFIFVTLGYHPDQIGGAYRYTTEVAERLALRGARVQVLYPAEVSQNEKEIRNGVELVRIPDADGWFFSNWRKENQAMASALNEALLEHSSDQKHGSPMVCLCHAFFGPAFSSVRLDRSLSKVFIYHGPWSEEFLYARRLSGGPFWRAWISRFIAVFLKRVEFKALKQSQAVALMSQSMRRRMLDLHGGNFADPEVIHGGVNEDQFQMQSDRDAIRKHYGLSEKDFLLLAVRRLDPRMGLDCLLKALARIQNLNPNVKLWIAGKGEQRSELEELALRLGVDKSFRLLGFVPEEELPELYNAADCVIMPSLDLEGFGLTTVEALACGAPVIGSDSGATPELLEPLEKITGKNLLFKSGCHESLSQALAPYVEGEQSLPDRKICRSYVKNRFTWRGPVEAHERIYMRSFKLHDSL